MNERRDVHGIVLLDKHQGLTSNRALQRVKRLFRARKAGHTGSLDPLATGLLPLCLGEATKISGFLLDANKSYRVTARLGETTDTCDAEGEIQQTRPVPELDEQAVDQALDQFRGDIEQIPPMYSALKQQGKRLYELARKGETVERPPRPVTIFRLDCIRRGPQELELEVDCSKGTYIRSLVADLGEVLGCGAHVSVLRRTGVEPFDSGQMVTEEDLESMAAQGDDVLDRILIRPDRALQHLPEVRLGQDSAHYVCQGQAVTVPGAPTSGELRLYGPDDHFLGIGVVKDDGRIGPRRLMRL